jgi:hypothetical protein
VNVHILSPPLWPKGTLSAVRFASLKLPPFLILIAREFELFFHSQPVSRKKKSSENRSSNNNCNGNNEYEKFGKDARFGKSGKKLLWCHGSGIISVTCNVQGSRDKHQILQIPSQSPSVNSSFTFKSVTLVLTAPQAAVLIAFDKLSGMQQNRKIFLSFIELSVTTGLRDEELRSVILSLSDKSLPLLEVLLDTFSYIVPLEPSYMYIFKFSFTDKHPAN